jgi:AraC-like DNA-binding protein
VVKRSVTTDPLSIAGLWHLARSGDLRGGAEAARVAQREVAPKARASRVELHLIAAFCSMRQGHHPEAARELDAACEIATSPTPDIGLALRVETWRAELAYMQGRNSEADATISSALPRLEETGDRAYVAFALRIRIAIFLARADYEAIAALADHAIEVAESSGDDYVIVQILNILGAAQFDRATSKLRQPHARAHLTVLDPPDAAPMEADAREALRFFERAKTVAERAHYEYAAWYVAGNIERLEILLGNAERAVRMIRKRLGVLQKRGARYDEIVTRSNLAWGLRTLGRYREALHELDVALDLVRATGTFNVLLEFLEYDRSIVLDALGDTAAARASYRRYLQLIGAWNRRGATSSGSAASATPKRPLEPYFLKRADRYVQEHLGEPFTVSELARHCGISWRTLEKAFMNFRSLTPVAHVRNLRLDHAHHLLDSGEGVVSEVAARCGFRSPTTFALEYRKRFGATPSRHKRAHPN